jgi:protein SCO1/2
MNPPARRVPWTLGIGLLLLLTLVLIFLTSALNARVHRMPHHNVLGQIADFTLTNQNGAAVSLADLRGHVWVADIIFTRCPGPCLKMSRQMQEIQQTLSPDSTVRLVSLTTDPDFDSPSVLKKYAGRFDADPARWIFLTGTKAAIGALASGTDSLNLSAVAVKPGERVSADDLFVHSTIFVVVDQRARLRGIFETSGEGVDWSQEKAKILAAARELEREP